ncbi:MAG: glycosyltransferase family 2 protein [Lachnospiraceae bacterium]|nr:glycosyltransferase family 2 protein [Lachnospiraceae bacterium]
MSGLYIVIPAYNEEENIDKCVNDWYPVVEKHNENGTSRLVIINDGSKDGTYEKLLELAKTRPLMDPKTKPNGGHGATVLSGYRYAIKKNAEWIFQTDSDGQTNPAEFEEFWEKREQYDAILGNRVVRGDGKDRKFVENTVCFLLRLVFGIKVQDANAPFRLMRTEVVKKYIGKLPRKFNIPNIMFTTYFTYFKERTLFIPISFKPREKGTNTINPKKIIKIGWKALGDFIKLRIHIND